MLSQPVDLSALVTLSQQRPEEFLEDDTLDVMVSKLLNCHNPRRCNRATRLDCLAVLSNVACDRGGSGFGGSSGDRSSGGGERRAMVCRCLMGVSEWFDAYLRGEATDAAAAADAADPKGGGGGNGCAAIGVGVEEPELHKAMLVLLARAWNYTIVTEDLLEQTSGNLMLALETVIGVLEDGESYTTGLRQRQAPGDGRNGQWEHELVCHRYEKPLVLQLCRLVKGFTHPGTYLRACEPSRPAAPGEAKRSDKETGDGTNSDGGGNGSSGTEERGEGGGGVAGSAAPVLTEYRVEQFSGEMDSLLEIVLQSHAVDKLSVALHACLFAPLGESSGGGNNGNGLGWGRGGGGDCSDEDVDGGHAAECKRCHSLSFGARGLEEADHLAVEAVHLFIQNLYHYGSRNAEAYRQHLLSDTILVPHLVLPYIDECVAEIHTTLAAAAADKLASDRRAEAKDAMTTTAADGALCAFAPALVRGMAASLRTLIIASFRAPATMFALTLMTKLNPTESLLRARPFVAGSPYVFALLCLLNVNMGALDAAGAVGGGGGGRKGGSSNGSGDAGSGGGGAGGGANDGDGDGDCSDGSTEAYSAHVLLRELSAIYRHMPVKARASVYDRVAHSGALPVSRDAPSYAAVLSFLSAAGGGGRGFGNGSTNGGTSGRGLREYKDGGEVEEEEDHWEGGRRAVKSASVERVAAAAAAAAATAAATAVVAGISAAGTARKTGISDGNDNSGGDGDCGSWRKQRQWQERQSADVGGGDGGGSRGPDDRGEEKPAFGRSQVSLLGDLPSLKKITTPHALEDLKRQRLRVELELPGGNRGGSGHRGMLSCSIDSDEGTGNGGGSRRHRERRPHHRGGGGGSIICGRRPGSKEEGPVGSVEDGHRNGVQHEEGVPREFQCAINGHLMKQPVRSVHGHAFELSTIRLWLETRGPVCPLTGKPLTVEDLLLDEALRTAIVRWHIKKMAVAAATATRPSSTSIDGDDIYDF